MGHFYSIIHNQVNPAIHVRGNDAIRRDCNHIKITIVAGQPHQARVIVVADITNGPRQPHLALGCGAV
jgi:hypothetical protein